MGAKHSSDSLGVRLLAGLTQTEITNLLDVLLQGLSSDRLEQSLCQLSADIQQTIRQILKPPTAEQPAGAEAAPPISLAKLSQTWSELWKAWDEVIWEASQEDGQYIEQEAHWEPPYFDSYAFATDLDKVAEQMQPLLQIAFEHGFTPDRGFAPALLEAEAEIAGGIPEWMEIVDGIVLETHTTLCLLKWEWFLAKAERQDAFQFAQHIRQLETGFSLIGINENALISFLCELPEVDQRCILTGLAAAKEAPPWRSALGNTYSPWHLFYMEAINQFAPEHYLDNLRLTIAQRWQNGLPVIEDLLAHKKYQESLQVIQETLSALFHSRHQTQAWTPETSLLVTLFGRTYNGEAFSEHQKTLLGYFQQTAQGLGQPERVNALKLQQIAYDHCFDWQRMFQAFTEVPVAQATRQTLFQSWQEYVIQRATPQSGGLGSRQPSEPGWIHWLIDSIADPQKGASWFQQQITQWLVNLPDNRQAMGNEYDRLRQLTKDLNAIQASKQEAYPLFNTIVIRTATLSAPDDASRQAYLQQLAPDDLWVRVMGYWKDHLIHFVPDPKTAHKSDYTQHAQWMAALRELNPHAYATLLAQWRHHHQRRTNLWKTLDKLGLG
jgi:hypothetical protein